MGKPLDSFKTLHEKRLYRKLMQILNDPTDPMRHYFDSRRSNRSGRFLLPGTNCYKASSFLVLLTSLNCCMSTPRLVHYALFLTPACWKSNNTNARLMAFAPGPHIWNSLPQDLRHCSTLSSFKAKLKNLPLLTVFLS